MRKRRSTNPSMRRSPALAAVALVALAPMMPLDAGGADDADPTDDATDESHLEVAATGEVIEEVVEEVVEEVEESQEPEPEFEELVVVEPATEACDVPPGDEITPTEAATVDAALECEADEDPVAEEPVDEPVVDEPVDEDPVVDEPVDEPVVEEPVGEEPVGEEPVDGGGDADEGTTADPVDAGDDASDDAGDDDADDAGDDAGQVVGPLVVEAAEPGHRSAELLPEPSTAPVLTATELEEAVEIDATDETDEAADGRGLRAELYDGVYAQGVPLWIAMTATRFLESSDNYEAEARGSTASGAYQVIDSTWNGYGGYARAVDAPPAVQDQFAYESMVAILKRFGNDVSAIPVAWYYPAALRNPVLMDIVPVPQAGNVLTPRQYQARWMALFHQHLENGSPVFLPADTDPLIPAIAFPVLGPTSFWDDWHADRDGGLRKHEGLDFMGENGQPLRAAFDGVVTRIRPTNVGRPGVGITITREDGIRANYFHLDAELRWHPDLDVGDTVKAGQIIAYMGDTGNAGIPHLHFELRTEEGEPIAPYPAALEAIQREQCSVGIGPWSTAFDSPAEIAEKLAAELLAAREAGIPAGLEGLRPAPEVREISGPDGALWTVTSDGGVTAEGVGALIAPGQGKCEQIPVEVFGTDAAGLTLDLLPEGWWGDEIDPEDLAAMIDAVRAERSSEFDELIEEFASRLRVREDRVLAVVVPNVI